MKASNKFLFILSFLVLIFLLLFDVYFYKEKVYGDSAFYLFEIINFKRFHVEHARPASLFIEVFPYVLAKLSMSMKAILLSFSLNIWFYYFICFIIIAYVLKSIQSGLGFLLVIIIGSRINYFNPVSELILSTPLVFIGFLIFNKQALKFYHILILILLFGFIIYSHPLYSILLPLLFFIQYIISKDINRNKIIFLLAFAGILIFHYLNLDEYDQDPLADLGNKEDSGFKLLLNFTYGRFFRAMLFTYPGLFILFGLSIYHLRKNNIPRLTILLIALSIIGYIFLVLYKYGRFFTDANEPFERYLFPVSLIIGFIYFNYCYRNNIRNNVLLFLIFVFHACLLLYYGASVQKRFSLLDKGIQYTQHLESGKYSFRSENYYAQKIGHDWIMSIESLLLSAADGPDATRQLFVEEYFSKDDLNSIAGNHFIRYPPMWKEGIENLNSDFFKLKENPLIYANTDSLQSGNNDEFFQNISIEVDEKTTLNVGRETLFPIVIFNKNSFPLTSGIRKELVYLSYHWNKSGETVIWDGERTAILGDVYKEVKQFIRVKAPSEKGKYNLELGLVYEGKKWAPVRSNQVKEILVK